MERGEIRAGCGGASAGDPSKKRKLKLSAERRGELKLEGQYMRSLKKLRPRARSRRSARRGDSLALQGAYARQQ
jgi:hypothetical protein